MRKRAQRKSKPTIEDPKHIIEQKSPVVEKKKIIQFKNWWIVFALIAIFFLVLFANTYFNYGSGYTINSEGEGFNKYYLSGPDPYYNLRLVEGTYETGKYPYFTESDQMLNYPLGARGARAPLLNMMALGFSRFIAPFTATEIDAIGFSMQFIPALFGALIIIPIYFIGKAVFNKKVGLIAAFFMAIIPIHIGSGHGSAYSLFDHDSFNLFLFFTTFLFLIYSIKEKNRNKSMIYAFLAGIPLAALSMTWVEARFLYVIIAVYTIVQMIIDILSNKLESKVFINSSIVLLTGYLISLPVIASKPEGLSLDVSLLMALVVLAFGVLYYIFKIRRIPWTLSIPIIFVIGGGGLAFLYIVNDLATSVPFFGQIQKLSSILFGTGIYGNKVSMTIAEASTYQISHTVMSFGPALYWLGWGGFVFMIWYYYKEKLRKDYLFLIVLFVINIWLAGTAGRFLNDMVPLIALLGAWMLWIFVEKVDFKQMVKNVKSAGGGFHGIRRGIKLIHVIGFLFIAFLVILPNAFVTFDASLPNQNWQKEDGTWTTLKWEYFGPDHSGAFGLGLYKEIYWTDALDWLAEQDRNITDPLERPAFISWWDYGFYEVALGGHPTVADNFQDGIPPASNFHTATSEKDAVTIWTTRLIEGDVINNDMIMSTEVKQVLGNYFGNDTEKIVSWFEDPTKSPSYNEYIYERFNEYIKKYAREEVRDEILRVGAQWPVNALYHDMVNYVNNNTYNITEEDVTWLYHDVQNVTGHSIRYYGVEGYDRQIFNIFAFLSDKSMILLQAPEDEFVKVMVEVTEYDPATRQIIDTYESSLEEYYQLDDTERSTQVPTNSFFEFKDAYFNTMFYKTFIGPFNEDTEGNREVWTQIQLPCINMKHFYGEYISKYPYYESGYLAVVIAKYYEGAFINGSLKFDGFPLNNTQIVVQKKLFYPGQETSIPIDHDLQNLDENGNFSLIAGADCIVQIRRYPELQANAFIVKNITFNSTDDPRYYPITDDDAMRKTNNYERILDNVTIEQGNLSGYIFNNTDDNQSFNKTIDEKLSDITVIIQEVDEFNTEDGRPLKYDFTDNTISDENGFYNFSGLEPGIYEIAAEKDGFILFGNYFNVRSGENVLDIRNPLRGSINGTVYFDTNKDGAYDLDEELEDVNLSLYYKSAVLGRGDIFIDSLTTSEDGFYSFDSLIPGQYIIKGEQDQNYIAEVNVTITENTSTQNNISMDFYPVRVSGYTKYRTQQLANITINIEPNMAIFDPENNTAVSPGEITSNETGFYEVDLKPGYYNVTINQSEGDTLVLTYQGKLNLTIGQGSLPNYDLMMTKHSVTVYGTVSYNGEPKSNIVVSFEPDSDVENNSAIDPINPNTNSEGFYSLEVAPGTYEIFINATLSEDGVNRTYRYERDNYIVVDTDQVRLDIELILIKEEP